MSHTNTEDVYSIAGSLGDEATLHVYRLALTWAWLRHNYVCSSTFVQMFHQNNYLSGRVPSIQEILKQAGFRVDWLFQRPLLEWVQETNDGGSPCYMYTPPFWLALPCLALSTGRGCYEYFCHVRIALGRQVCPFTTVIKWNYVWHTSFHTHTHSHTHTHTHTHTLTHTHTHAYSQSWRLLDTCESVWGDKSHLLPRSVQSAVVRSRLKVLRLRQIPEQEEQAQTVTHRWSNTWRESVSSTCILRRLESAIIIVIVVRVTLLPTWISYLSLLLYPVYMYVFGLVFCWFSK